MVIAAIDFGRKWVGIAVSGPDGSGAYPVSTLRRYSLARDLEALRSLLTQYEVSRAVVGMPINMDGTSGPQALAAEAFARQLREFTGLEVETFDERLTSFEAEERLKTLGSRKKRKEHAIDAIAACVILEGWQQRQSLR